MFFSFKRAHNFLLLFFFLGCGTALGGPGADTGMILNPSPELARYSGKWFARLRPARSDRAMALVVISNRQCVGCSGAAVRALRRDLEREHLRTDLGLVVLCDIPGEGRAAARALGVGRIIEHVGREEVSAIHADDEPGATVIVVSATGRPVYLTHDLTHNGAHVVEICRSLEPVSRPGGAVTVTRIRPQRDYVVTEMASIAFNPVRRSFAFIDPTTNEAGSCSLERPAFRRIIDSVPELDYWFKPKYDTLNYWEQMIANYPRFSALQGVVRDAGDTLQCVAKLFTGYNVVPLEDGRTRLMLTVSQARCRAIGGKFDDVRLIHEPQFTINAPMSSLGDDIFAAPVIWNTHLEDSARAALHPDSSLAVAVFEGDRINWRASLPFTEVQRQYGRGTFWLYTRYIAAGDGRSYYYLDPGNRAAMRISWTAETRATQKLQVAGRLAQMFADTAESPEGAPEWKAIGILGGRECTVAMTLTDATGLLAVTVQQYGPDGRLQRETEWKGGALRRMGRIFDMSPIMADETGVYLAAKGKKSGWVLIRLTY